MIYFNDMTRNENNELIVSLNQYDVQSRLITISQSTTLKLKEEENRDNSQ